MHCILIYSSKRAIDENGTVHSFWWIIWYRKNGGGGLKKLSLLWWNNTFIAQISAQLHELNLSSLLKIVNEEEILIAKRCVLIFIVHKHE